jgi:hypothetical protein
MAPQAFVPGPIGPPCAHILPAPQAATLPQRQLLVLVSHHSPGAQQLSPQQTPVSHWAQLGAHA